MPKAELVAGDRFGVLRVESTESKEVTRYDGDGIEYSQYEKVYALLCDCGKRLEVPVSDFNGKRAVRDCGCGKGYQNEPMQAVFLQLNTAMVGKAKGIAKRQGTTLSQFIRDCMQAGIEGRIKR